MKVLVGKDADMKEGRLKGSKVDDRSFVVGRYKGQLFGIDGKCSHAGFDLSYGTIRDGTVVCPAHGAEFDVRTGKKRAGPGGKDLRAYIVSVEDGEVFIDI